jgi:hypothetical protein
MVDYIAHDGEGNLLNNNTLLENINGYMITLAPKGTFSFLFLYIINTVYIDYNIAYRL